MGADHGRVNDASTSRTDDGPGSLKLVTPMPTGSMAFSDYITVEGGKKYTRVDR